MSKDIGERVKAVRGLLNQREFAEALGVSHGSVSQIEQGKAMPSGEFLLRINQQFNADITWLLTGMSNVNSIPSKPILNQREQALLDNYRHCDELGQDAVERVAFVASKPRDAKVANAGNKKI